MHVGREERDTRSLALVKPTGLFPGPQTIKRTRDDVIARRRRQVGRKGMQLIKNYVY